LYNSRNAKTTIVKPAAPVPRPGWGSEDGAGYFGGNGPPPPGYYDANPYGPPVPY